MMNRLNRIGHKDGEVLHNYDQKDQSFKRQISTQTAFSLSIGSIFGVGIFITQPTVAAALKSPFWILAIWFIGGLISFCGALSLAELATRMPMVGGEYNYLRKIYGEFWGFLYGYLGMIISFPGSIAIMATSMFFFQGTTLIGPEIHNFAIRFWGFELTWVQILATAMVIALTMINHWGVNHGILLQKLVTTSPILFLIPSSLYILWKNLVDSSPHPFPLPLSAESFRIFDSISFSASFPSLTSIAVALTPIFWAYTGWNSMLYLSSEIRNPTRTIPKAMLGGLVFVTFVYLLLTSVIVSVIPTETLISGTSSNTDFFEIAWKIAVGENSAIVISGIIFLLILGSLNTTILAGTRLLYAMAKDGITFRQFSIINPRSGTPILALWIQTLCSIIFILTIRNLETLIQITSLIMLFLSGICLPALFFLDTPMPLKSRFLTFGYPLAPILYFIAIIGISTGLIYKASPLTLSISTILFFSSFIAYKFLRKKEN